MMLCEKNEVKAANPGIQEPMTSRPGWAFTVFLLLFLLLLSVEVAAEDNVWFGVTSTPILKYAVSKDGTVTWTNRYQDESDVNIKRMRTPVTNGCTKIAYLDVVRGSDYLSRSAGGGKLWEEECFFDESVSFYPGALSDQEVRDVCVSEGTSEVKRLEIEFTVSTWKKEGTLQFWEIKERVAKGVAGFSPVEAVQFNVPVEVRCAQFGVADAIRWKKNRSGVNLFKGGKWNRAAERPAPSVVQGGQAGKVSRRPSTGTAGTSQSPRLSQANDECVVGYRAAQLDISVSGSTDPISSLAESITGQMGITGSSPSGGRGVNYSDQVVVLEPGDTQIAFIRDIKYLQNFSAVRPVELRLWYGIDGGPKHWTTLAPGEARSPAAAIIKLRCPASIQSGGATGGTGGRAVAPNRVVPTRR